MILPRKTCGLSSTISDIPQRQHHNKHIDLRRVAILHSRSCAWLTKNTASWHKPPGRLGNGPDLRVYRLASVSPFSDNTPWPQRYLHLVRRGALVSIERGLCSMQPSTAWKGCCYWQLFVLESISSTTVQHIRNPQQDGSLPCSTRDGSIPVRPNAKGGGDWFVRVLSPLASMPFPPVASRRCRPCRLSMPTLCEVERVNRLRYTSRQARYACTPETGPEVVIRYFEPSCAQNTSPLDLPSTERAAEDATPHPLIAGWGRVASYARNLKYAGHVRFDSLLGGGKPVQITRLLDSEMTRDTRSSCVIRWFIQQQTPPSGFVGTSVPICTPLVSPVLIAGLALFPSR